MRVWMFAIALAAACGNDVAPQGHMPDAAILPDASGSGPQCSNHPVSFQHDVVPLVNHCGGELCHGGLGTSWPYSALAGGTSTECTDHRPLVRPGDPGHSYLLDKLLGRDMCTGAQMPQGGPWFSAADLQTITDWICEGAPNN